MRIRQALGYAPVSSSLLAALLAACTADGKGGAVDDTPTDTTPAEPDTDTDQPETETDTDPPDTETDTDTDPPDTDTDGDDSLEDTFGDTEPPVDPPVDPPIDTSLCPDDVVIDTLPLGPASRFRACTDAFASAQDCIANCDARCQADLAGQFDYSDTACCAFLGSVLCGPIWVDGACCIVAEGDAVDVGRPLRVAGEPRTAPAAGVEGWTEQHILAAPPSRLRSTLIDAWTRRGLAEHASVASFARVQLELLHLGAPAELIAEVCRAMADEVEHARACFGVASAWAGRPVGPGPMDLRGVVPSRDAATVLIDTLVEGCVGETIGASEATLAAARCTDPGLRRLLRRIAAEEARHAALAWRTARWIVERHPELRGVVVPTLLRAVDAVGAAAGDRRGLTAWGILDGADLLAVVLRVKGDMTGHIAATAKAA